MSKAVTHSMYIFSKKMCYIQIYRYSALLFTFLKETYVMQKVLLVLT